MLCVLSSRHLKMPVDNLHHSKNVCQDCSHYTDVTHYKSTLCIGVHDGLCWVCTIQGVFFWIQKR